MHANNDSLGVRSAPFPAQIGGKTFLKSSLPDRLSSSGRITILGTTPRSCREVIAVPVDKIALRGKEATESAGRMAGIRALRLTRSSHGNFSGYRGCR
jgi:hypothetical protein